MPEARFGPERRPWYAVWFWRALVLLALGLALVALGEVRAIAPAPTTRTRMMPSPARPVGRGARALSRRSQTPDAGSDEDTGGPRPGARRAVERIGGRRCSAHCCGRYRGGPRVRPSQAGLRFAAASLPRSRTTS